ncbi:MAG TPA: Ig-like domain-containing protein [Longimicrobiaceae bacterium]|nr:Ig-like domain-containing protein [Longimicrobiaceae bacterium]
MSHPLLRRRAMLAAALLSATACADRNPAAPPDDPRQPPPAAALVACTADVRTGTVQCAAQGASTPSGMSAVILGGQGTNVRLRSSGTHYDGTSVFRTDVSVENLTAQALGTVDGVTPSTNGVRVFFESGPNVTGGTGTVSVANADGQAAFTRAEQPYFRYAGILAPGSTTPAREWRFTVPSTVTSFSFSLYVAADVRVEGGWIELSPVGPSLVEGDTQRLAPVVRGVTGRVLPGEAVTWESSDPVIATVDGAGLVTARVRGTATITATAGGRSGRVSVQVTPTWEKPAPTVVGIELPPAGTANGADSLRLRVIVRAPGTGATYAFINLQAPTFPVTVGCDATGVTSGTPQAGVFECATTIPSMWRSGMWRVKSVSVGGDGVGRTVTGAELAAAGAKVDVQVHSPDEDVTPPVISSVTFSADSITAGDGFSVRFVASDAGVGAYSASILLRNAASGQPSSCATVPFVESGNTATFFCNMLIGEYVQGGSWVVQTLRVTDRIGNYTALATTAAVDSAGYPTVLKVHGPNPDLVAPTFTGYALSADSVAANGVDEVRLEITADDEYSGITSIELRLRNQTTLQARDCSVRPPFLPGGRGLGPPSHTLECVLRFTAGQAGIWRAEYVRAFDAAGNARVLRTADLQAIPVPTDVKVTP